MTAATIVIEQGDNELPFFLMNPKPCALPQGFPFLYRFDKIFT